MKDHRRNAEGYMDMTAYLAIEKAEREMNMLPKSGEIWNVDNSGVERTVVVVAAHEEHCTVLLLNDLPKNAEDIKITARSAMYTDPSMIAYRFNRYFIEMIKKMPDEEFADLLGAVADALCIQTDEQTDRVADLEAELEEAQCEIYKLEQENAELRTAQTTGTDVALKAERDVYKRMYEQLITKMVEGRCVV